MSVDPKIKELAQQYIEAAVDVVIAEQQYNYATGKLNDAREAKIAIQLELSKYTGANIPERTIIIIDDKVVRVFQHSLIVLKAIT